MNDRKFKLWAIVTGIVTIVGTIAVIVTMNNDDAIISMKAMYVNDSFYLLAIFSWLRMAKWGLKL